MRPKSWVKAEGDDWYIFVDFLDYTIEELVLLAGMWLIPGPADLAGGDEKGRRDQTHDGSYL
jgi:hypothetical protein